MKENINIFRTINEDKIKMLSTIFEKKNTKEDDIINEIYKYMIPCTIDEIIEKWKSIRKEENVSKDRNVLNIGKNDKVSITMSERENSDRERNSEKSQEIIKWLIDNKEESSKILMIDEKKMRLVIKILCIESDNVYLYKIINGQSRAHEIYPRSICNKVYNEERKYKEEGDIIIKKFELGLKNYISWYMYSYKYMSFELYTAIKLNSIFIFKYLINEGHRIPLKSIIKITDNFEIFEYLEHMLNIKWNNVHLNYCCNLYNDKIFDFLFYEKKAKIKLHAALSQTISNISSDLKYESHKICFLNKIIGLFQKNHLHILSYLLYKKFNSSFHLVLNLLSLDNISYYIDHNLIKIAIKNCDLSTLVFVNSHNPKLYNSFTLDYFPAMSLDILKYLSQCKVIISSSLLIDYSSYISLDTLKFLLEDCKITLPDPPSFFVSCFLSKRRDLCSYLNHRYHLVEPYHDDLFIYTI